MSTAISAGLESNQVTTFAMDGDGLWLSAGRTISRMTGDGATQFDWATYDLPIALDQTDESVTAFAVAGDRIAVATSHTVQTSAGTFDVGDGIYLSADGGVSWDHFGMTVLFTDRADMTIPGGEALCFGLWFDGPRLWAAYMSEFAVMTPDDGATWHRFRPDSTSNPLPEPYLDDPQRLHRYLHLNYRAFDGVADDGVVWIATNAGVNRSTDGGTTWQNYDAVSAGLTGDFATAVAVDPLTGTIWAGTQSTGIDEADLRSAGRDLLADGVFDSLDYDLDRDGRVDGVGVNGISWSTDGGAHWQSYVPREDPAVGVDFRAWNFAFHGSTVWVAGAGGGRDAILRSDDGGASWRLAPIVTATGDTAFSEQGVFDVAYAAGAAWVATERGLARSSDDGASWAYVLRFPQTRPLGGGGVLVPTDIGSGLRTYAFPSPSAPRRGVPPNITFALRATADVTIRIYDAGGALVREIVRDALPVGNHTVDWNGRTGDGRFAANGVYVYEITTSDGHSARGKMMVLN